MPPQLEKNYVGPTSWQIEARARDGAFPRVRREGGRLPRGSHAARGPGAAGGGAGRGTLRSSLRSPAEVDGTQGFLPQPEKDLE